jgi:four helix bundle protein
MRNDKEIRMNKDNSWDLKSRTKSFALRVIKLFSSLPKTTEAQVLGKQVLRSGTSVGAQYREADRAKSTADFISKMEGALQELDETVYWFELLIESGIVRESLLAPLVGEANELISILSHQSKPPVPKHKNTQFHNSAFDIPHSAFKKGSPCLADSRFIC